MTKRADGDNVAAARRRVLQGYRQQGKRFIPPFLDGINKQETSWIQDRVPELVWVALLIHVLGLRQGVHVATSVAKTAALCNQGEKRAFAAISDYATLSSDDKQCIRAALRAEGTLDRARGALAALVDNYDVCPLSFLADEPAPKPTSVPDSTLADLKDTIASISDRTTAPGIFAQATVVHIAFVNDTLKVAPGVGLEDLSTIEAYPSTEESQQAAAFVRSTVTMLLSWDISPDWGSAFWRTGQALEACEVGI